MRNRILAALMSVCTLIAFLFSCIPSFAAEPEDMMPNGTEVQWRAYFSQRTANGTFLYWSPYWDGTSSFIRPYDKVVFDFMPIVNQQIGKRFSDSFGYDNGYFTLDYLTKFNFPVEGGYVLQSGFRLPGLDARHNADVIEPHVNVSFRYHYSDGQAVVRDYSEYTFSDLSNGVSDEFEIPVSCSVIDVNVVVTISVSEIDIKDTPVTLRGDGIFVSYSSYLSTDQSNHDEHMGFLGSILNGISNIASNIVSWIVDALKKLFIPEEDYFSNLMDDVTAFFEGRFGFLTYPFRFAQDLFSFFLDWTTIDPAITIPPLSLTLGGKTYQYFGGYTYNFETNSVPALFNYVRIFTSCILVGGFIMYLWKMFNQIVGGRES